ncbi:MAG: ion channel [Chitinophagaceae bacterium]|nr:ion channel [Chitinophagaceae bacterium]
MAKRISSDWHIWVSLVFLVLSFVFLRTSLPSFLVLTLLVLVNLYTISFTFIAAVVSDGKSWFKGDAVNYLPTRVEGFVIFAFLLFAAAFLFADIYLTHTDGFKDPLQGELDALYYSFMTISTMGVEGIAPQTSELKRWVMFEVITSLNFFLGAFALLVSRITNF